MGSVLTRHAGWFVGCLLATLVLPVYAGEAAQRYGCEQPIRLALYENRVFYRDGQGIDPDMVAELQRRSGCRFEIGLLPRSEIWLRLQNGGLDMATSGIPTIERRRFAFFLPYMYQRNKLIVPVALAPGITTFADFQRLPGARLGVVASYRHGSYLDSGVRLLRAAGRVQEYPDDQARFAALQSGEVQALIGHDLNLSGTLPAEEQLKYRVIDVVPGPSIPTGMVLARNRFSPAQAAEWLRLIESMRLDGRLAAILRGHAPPHLAEELLSSGYRYELARREQQP
ncbi:substrate-binding periplasmic protein [Pseudomonas sp. Gutcm_11s]|uniref:substrate-binding periplasmic protein n=1 Tax=Pseudomonas sp. Gutcm_11s TaxID=3026088 RepID=UPI002362BF08|nr:transporter substrate-binding domain-containing protein [Pseudomonas sp. Gutcm_11s]MDD0844062.1 transporter substrate-binding domain-containing protein [Pseudomonas sp. Gutcm_11s]